MCGIFGCVGVEEAGPVLLEGLRSLEYRGYDSAGIFIPGHQPMKAVGVIANLAEKHPEKLSGTSGIAHTRWATHGEPNEVNAHPHRGYTDKLWIVHNGIIENYKELKAELTQKGHTFFSDTDTEVLAHAIEVAYDSADTLEEAVTAALKRVRGTYGIAVMHNDEPDKIVVARMGSPIVLGIGTHTYFVASDPSAILKHTKDVVYLNDGEIAVLTPAGYNVLTLDLEALDRTPDTIEWDAEQVQKAGYEHFMLKEIMEAPEVLQNSVRGRLVSKNGTAKLGGLERVEEQLAAIKNISIVACGTASYAGMIGRYMLEEYGGVHAEIDIASEFRYRNARLDENTAVLAISQSGETADTLASIKEAHRKGLLTLGIVNVVGSTIARETDAGVYNHAGPEISVASTKAFLSQVEILALLTLFLGRQRDMSLKTGQEIIKEIELLPEKASTILKQHEQIHELAKKYKDYTDFFYVGRKYNFPTAYEGAIKLKEISYIHAEGYGAGEMKHGPIALIDKHFPTVAIAPYDSVYEKTISNIQETKARGGPVLAIATEGDTEITELVDDVIYVPKTHEMLSPILTTIPLHLFAYYMALENGRNIDKPRNLAKSVTVE